MSRLQPIDLIDFTGGLDARRSPLTVPDNASPDMLNIEIDPATGFGTRRGWQRWNPSDIVSPPDDFRPRRAKLHPISDGSYRVFVAHSTPTDPLGGTVSAASVDGVFSWLATPILCNADKHRADFAAWGDVMYVACGRGIAGRGQGTVRVEVDGTVNELTEASSAYNDDYTAPVGGAFPHADFAEAHSGYLFVAGVYESDGSGFWANRIRWSHPNEPEDWATLDFLDIERGGGKITGLLSFQDHLLIFKTDSVWALYGYDLDSWQLIEVSTSIGVPNPNCFARSESAVYFYSASDRGGIFGYSGGSPVPISERVRPIVQSIQDVDEVATGWLGRRLWVSSPYRFGTILVFDPEVGSDGSWIAHQPAVGTLGVFVERSDIGNQYPMAVMNGDSGGAPVVFLDFRDDALDVFAEDYRTILVDATDGDRLKDKTDDGFLLWDKTASQIGAPFEAYYRTNWKHGGWPERRKSWRRPRYAIPVPVQEVAIRANVYWDYDEANPRRVLVGRYDSSGGKLWTKLGAANPNGFDWGDGTDWGPNKQGATLERVSRGLGVSRVLQLEIRSDPSTPGAAWSIDSIHLKHIPRRYTT